MRKSPSHIQTQNVATNIALPARWPVRRIIGELSKNARALVVLDLQSEA
ncbi:MAG: hypothetical protein ABIU96_14675 [Rhodanobacter sp.]